MSGLFDMTRLSFQTLSEIAHRTAHMADFLDEEDRSDLLLVHVFDTEAQRDVFLASLPLRAQSHPR